MSLELILISISYLFVYISIIYDDIIGILSTIIILVIGAAETAIGLTLIMYIP
jgi:NADH:ubiquinone oxidoreductase subunit K